MSVKNKRRWRWLILGIPAALVLVLFLLFALIVGSHLIGAFIGPVNFFNSASHIPADAEVQGTYQLSIKDSRNTENSDFKIPDDSGFTLGPNHSLEVHDLPNFNGFGKPAGCAYNGTGKWLIFGSGSSIRLTLNVTTVLPAKQGHLPSCPPKNFGGFAILGHSRPYRFWYYTNDPDEGQGLLYKLR